MVFWHTVELVWRRTRMAFIITYWLNWNLQVILLQMTNDFLSLDSRSRFLSTENLSLYTIQLVLPQHTTRTCLMSALLAAWSRRVQDWGNNSGLSGWVLSPPIVVSDCMNIRSYWASKVDILASAHRLDRLDLTWPCSCMSLTFRSLVLHICQEELGRCLWKQGC